MSGLVLRLAPPEDAAREQIIRHVSAVLGRPLSDQAAGRLAAGVTGTVNDLFGALFELNADNSGRAASDVRRVERYLATRAARRPSLQAILRVVGKHYAVPQKVLKSASRRQAVVFARAMAVYLARELAGVSYQRIGAALGGRDHSTMLHNYRKIVRRLDRDSACRDAIDELRTLLQDDWSSAHQSTYKESKTVVENVLP
jgi:chromosomal replication initiator protein